ncbi:MAG: hypothetical protein ACXWIN_07930 [Burkholderiaceae bacterium]
MKNRHVEQLKRSAKLSNRTSRTLRFQNGIAVHHHYDEENPKKISWWDDVAFVLNDYLVNVAWTHPRYVYKDKFEELADDVCVNLRSSQSLNILAKTTPNYRKVGKSRKKIDTYNRIFEQDDEYYDAIFKEEKRIARDPNNGIVITPSVTAEWTKWSRFVRICAPIEVRGVKDLHELARLTKRLLKRETTLQREFPGYTYSQKDWITEFDETDEIGLLSHAVKT